MPVNLQLLINWWEHLLAPGVAGALWRACWQGGLAILLSWAGCRAWPGMPARLREWLWRLAYLKLLLAWLCAGALTVALLPATFAPWSAPAPDAPPASPQITTATAPTTLTTSTPAVERTAGRVQSAAGSAPLTAPSRISPASVAAPPPRFQPWSTLLPMLCALWLLGVAVGVLRLLLAIRRVRRLRQDSHMVNEEAVLRLRVQVVKQMGLRRAPLLLAHPAAGPLLLGTIHPVIIVPEAMLAGDSADLRLALAHELAHVRRRDILWGWLPALAELLFFFHPLLYPARRECRLAQEIACDAEALARTGASPHAYGAMLLHGAAGRAAFRPLPVAVGIFESFHTLHRRLTAMNTHALPLSRRRRMLYGVMVCTLALAALLPWRLAADTSLTQTPELLLQAHYEGLCGCRISPDDKYMVTWTETPVIWNLSSGVIEQHIPGIEMPTDALFSPDGRFLFIRSYRRNVIWDMQHRIVVQSWDENTNCARFTPDGKGLWTSRVDKAAQYLDRRSDGLPEQDSLVLRNIADGKVEHTVPVPDGWTADISPDGTKALSRDTNCVLTVWDTRNGQQLSRLPSDKLASVKIGWGTLAAAFSPDSGTVISYPQRVGSVTCWNCTTGMKVKTLPADFVVEYATFSPDGRRMAVELPRKTEVLDVQTGQVLCTLLHAPTPQMTGVFPPVLEFTHDGAGLYTSEVNNTSGNMLPIYRWDIATGHMLRRWKAPAIPHSLRAVAITTDGKQLAAGAGENRIALWDIAQGCIRKELTLPGDNMTDSLAFDANGTLLAAGLTTSTGKYLAHVMIWNMATGAFIKDLLAPEKTNHLFRMAFSPDGTRLAVACSRPSKVVVWNTVDWSIAQQFAMPGFDIHALAFSPDGRWLSWSAMVLSDPAPGVEQYLAYSSLTTLELATGKTREIHTGKNEFISNLIYSPDSRLFAATYNPWRFEGENAIAIYDAVTGEKKITVKPASQLKHMPTCGFSADGSTIFGVDSAGGLTAWDAGTGEIKQQKTLPGYMELTDGGRAGLLCGDDPGVQLWDTRQLLATNEPHPIATFYWLNDGKWLITTPQGYFDCSDGLDDAIYWKAGNEIYPYEKFARQLHQPELMRRALQW